MSDPQTIQMTPAGYDALVQELNELTNVKIPTAIDRLSQARSHGDLSENAEYHAAKEDLTMLEGRRDELEALIARAQIVQPATSNGHVAMGSQVVIEIDGKKATHLYHIVGEWEADPAQKKISEKSPLGQALIGKKKGERVEVAVPAGKVVYVIKDIQ